MGRKPGECGEWVGVPEELPGEEGSSRARLYKGSRKGHL